MNTPEERKGVRITGFSRGLANVEFEGKNQVPDRCNFSGEIKIGYATTLGYNNFLHGHITVGKYCQFGADVALHATNHPMNYLTTYINANLFEGELKQLKEQREILVGNDVWIGHNAMIVGNVSVGNGAIVAAGAVVTKDVPAYAVVAGVPAKIVKMRFSDEVIAKIQDLKWWDMTQTELQQHKQLFQTPITDDFDPTKDD
ncbi:CatB-related O-acetyltransferase [Aureitalea marina]|uniref:CatB-related O-acetyltransferase n=1 Tax=Aureitalea marina TaxID=930804 RepID=UPI001C613216|nr:CatB-related O-acetyltransferase [Aureitalea marina]